MEKKHFLFALFTLLSVWNILLSCSKDDDVERIIDDKEKIDSVFFDGEDVPIAEADSIQIRFCLLNEQGDTTKTFTKGETIVFDLWITNRRTRVFILDYKRIYGDELFRVYSSKGQDMGTSWTYPDVMNARLDALISNGTHHCVCPWPNVSSVKPTYPLILKESIPVLPAGHYYAVAPIHISDKECITCKIYFTIIEL